MFVGRITRQKGLPYLLRAVAMLPKDVQVVLCAGAPDTKEIAAEVSSAVATLQETRDGVMWIEQMLPRPELVAVLDACTAFVCPSVYEPLGIVNLEAMAVGLPVVGTATGGIPEVVVDGVTGTFVPIDQATTAQGLLRSGHVCGRPGGGNDGDRVRCRCGQGDGRPRPSARRRALLVGGDRRAHPRRCTTPFSARASTP